MSSVQDLSCAKGSEEIFSLHSRVRLDLHCTQLAYGGGKGLMFTQVVKLK